MLKQPLVTIDLVTGKKDEYIVRDNTGITIGRIFIVEISKKNNFCTLRIKFYKKGSSSYRLLQDSLRILLKMFFQNMNLNKINILADDDINISPFTDLNFKLEGIISENIKINSNYKNEVLFALTVSEFNRINIKKGLYIDGDNIYLSVLTPEDSQKLLYYYLNNKEYLKEFEPDRENDFYTLDAQKAHLIESYKEFISGKSVNFGIYKNKKFIGKIQISNIAFGVFKNAFVGYSIDRDEQNKGYMKEALRLAMKYAFDKIKLHRLEASTLVYNLKSQSVLKSCGFIELGISKKYLFINGKWRDHIIFYKINPNF